MAADIRPLSRVVTLSSDGNRGPEPPTGSGEANITVSGSEGGREGGRERDLLAGSLAKVRPARLLGWIKV